jgi:hypothetical protein
MKNNARNRQEPTARSAGKPKMSRNKPLPSRCQALAWMKSAVTSVTSRPSCQDIRQSARLADSAPHSIKAACRDGSSMVKCSAA